MSIKLLKNTVETVMFDLKKGYKVTIIIPCDGVNEREKITLSWKKGAASDRPIKAEYYSCLAGYGQLGRTDRTELSVERARSEVVSYLSQGGEAHHYSGSCRVVADNAGNCFIVAKRVVMDITTFTQAEAIEALQDALITEDLRNWSSNLLDELTALEAEEFVASFLQDKVLAQVQDDCIVLHSDFFYFFK